MDRRIVSTSEDFMTGDFSIDLSDGRRVWFDRRLAQKEPLETLLKHIAIVPSNDRVDVIHYGRKIGELPSFWSPALAKSTSFLFIYRTGDMTLQDGKWHASRTLGAGDLDCLVGFVRKPSTPTPPASGLGEGK